MKLLHLPLGVESLCEKEGMTEMDSTGVEQGFGCNSHRNRNWSLKH
jgi:hypothetical protein